MEGLMEPYLCHEIPVKDARDHLPQYLDEAYPAAVPTALQNEDNCLKGALLRQGPTPKVRLGEV